MATATINKARAGTRAERIPSFAKNAKMGHPRSKNSTVQPGRFGVYGGRYVPETLMAVLEELEREYEKAKCDRKFQQRLDELLRTYAGRPTPLFLARRLTPGLTRSTIVWDRRCWSSAWASIA